MSKLALTIEPSGQSHKRARTPVIKGWRLLSLKLWVSSAGYLDTSLTARIHRVTMTHSSQAPNCELEGAVRA